MAKGSKGLLAALVLWLKTFLSLMNNFKLQESKLYAKEILIHLLLKRVERGKKFNKWNNNKV
jgi:hypothetical protein